MLILKKIFFLVLGEDPTQGLDNNAIAAEDKFLLILQNQKKDLH